MQAQDIKELFALQDVLSTVNIVGEPEVLAALLDWKSGAGQNGAPDTQVTKAAAPEPAPKPEPAPTRTRTKRQPASAPADQDTDF